MTCGVGQGKVGQTQCTARFETKTRAQERELRSCRNLMTDGARRPPSVGVYVCGLVGGRLETRGRMPRVITRNYKRNRGSERGSKDCTSHTYRIQRIKSGHRNWKRWRTSTEHSASASASGDGWLPLRKKCLWRKKERSLVLCGVLHHNTECTLRAAARRALCIIEPQVPSPFKIIISTSRLRWVSSGNFARGLTNIHFSVLPVPSDMPPR